MRFYNRGQNSLRTPNTNRTKTTCLLFLSCLFYHRTLLLSPTPSPYAMTTEHRQPKNQLLTFSPCNSTKVTSPSPPPPYAMLMWVVMLARKLFVTQKTTLSRGGGGDLVVCLSTSERVWKANFLIGFVHVRLIVFQITGSLKVSTVNEPCLVTPVVVSISNVCDDIMVCFGGL